MNGDDDRLWADLCRALEHRPGWSIQDSTTPGDDPVWTRSHRGRVDLSAAVDRGSVVLYDEDTDAETRFDSAAAFASWLEADGAGGGRPGT